MQKKLSFVLLIANLLFTVGCSNNNSSQESNECNHHEVIDIGYLPTCTKSGLTDGSHCDICNKVIVAQEVIEPLGHKLEIDAKVDATCTKDGLTEGSHCSRCSEIITSQEVIEKTGHKEIIDEAREGTCISKGLTEGSHCEYCGTVLKAQEETEFGTHKKARLIDIPLESGSQVALFECEHCHESFYSEITPNDINMPIVNINGSLDGISKEDKKKVKISYDDGNLQFTYDSTIKIQGATSATYPKKNYNIQFFKDDTFDKKQKVEIKPEWGKQNKYTLKANWIDFSQARNVVSAKIYGDIVASKDIDDEYANLINGGAIDGFPVLVYINGECNGLYTFNTPKDKWIFNMDGDEEDREALVMGDAWSDAVSLKEKMSKEINKGWELEYSSTEDTGNNDWISASFNEMIDFLNNNSGQAFKNGIDKYVNVYRVIDAMLYTWFIRADDNTSKNILWATYDGVKWQPSVYDLDGTWGLRWDGQLKYGTEYTNVNGANLLWKKIWDNYKPEIINEWFELRRGPLSYSNIKEHFTEFIDSIDPALYAFDKKKWPDVPSHDTNNLSQILNWAYEKGTNQDNYFKSL